MDYNYYEEARVPCKARFMSGAYSKFASYSSDQLVIMELSHFMELIGNYLPPGL